MTRQLDASTVAPRPDARSSASNTSASRIADDSAAKAYSVGATAEARRRGAPPGEKNDVAGGRASDRRVSATKTAEQRQAGVAAAAATIPNGRSASARTAMIATDGHRFVSNQPTPGGVLSVTEHLQSSSASTASPSVSATRHQAAGAAVPPTRSWSSPTNPRPNVSCGKPSGGSTAKTDPFRVVEACGCGTLPMRSDARNMVTPKAGLARSMPLVERGSDDSALAS
jgi:hypothetical protein